MSEVGTRAQPRFAYVGSRTTRERHARGEGISVYAVDAEGGLARVQVVGDLTNPSFLALNRARSRLYAVHGDGFEISVFAVDAKTGFLSFLQRQACGGRNPVHVALDPREQWLVVSDHLGTEHGGSVLVMPVAADGTLLPVSQRVELPGKPGPHRKEQPFAKPHFNPFDPSGRFVVVPDKGQDRVFVFRFEAGLLEPAAQPWADTREGAGPRHVAFHPSGRFAYVVNELDSTVTAYRFDSRSGGMEPMQILSSLPDHFTGNSRAAEIEVATDGKTLYASNRGFDCIAVFRIDQNTGSLSFCSATSTHGRTPRYFALGSGGKTLYALNEDSDSIVTIKLEATGELGPVSSFVACGSPVCLVF